MFFFWWWCPASVCMTRWWRPCCRRYPTRPSPLHSLTPNQDGEGGVAMDKLASLSPAFKAHLALILHIFLSLVVYSSAKRVDKGLPFSRDELTFLKLYFASELEREWHQHVLLPAEENRRMCKEVGLSVSDEETGKGRDRDRHSPLSSARSQPLLLRRVCRQQNLLDSPDT